LGLSRPSTESRHREVDSVIVIKEQLTISYMTTTRNLRPDRFPTNRNIPDQTKRRRQRCCLSTRRTRGAEWADESVIMSSQPAHFLGAPEDRTGRHVKSTFPVPQSGSPDSCSWIDCPHVQLTLSIESMSNECPVHKVFGMV